MSSHKPKGKELAALSLIALGIVFGDIGTSPLYAIHECFFGEYGIPVNQANVFGVLSLILWSLIIVVTVKYLTFIMLADNNGEGGVLALMALAHSSDKDKPRSKAWILVLGLFGAALLYGDGMITPAISVLSAVEGLKVATTVFKPYVIPITIVILTGLFMFQYRGTGGVGAIFGPFTLLWFIVLAILGVRGIMMHPAVIGAVNPWYAIRFFMTNGWHGFFVLGAVFLVVTGGEALYADMGHFGKRPIKLAWYGVVLPALILNYFGQGALLVSRGTLLSSPFYMLAPAWALYPLVGLATIATVIASQAVISGAFSLTRQAIQLGFSPRLKIEHTSDRQIGQIYVPPVNWVLMLSTIALVLGFKTSSHLAAAYGVAVTATMVITSVLYFMVLRHRWGWNLIGASALVGVFLIVDLAFFSANIVKIAHGAWFPLAVAAGVYILMTTWKMGRQRLAAAFRAKIQPIEVFMDRIQADPPLRVPGTAVFMTGNPGKTPPALLDNLKHNKVLHERVILLTVTTLEIPYVHAHQRLDVTSMGQDFYQVTIRFGFKETPDVPKALKRAKKQDLDFDISETSFFLGRERLFPKKRSGMPLWREQIFAFMSRNALGATTFYHIPPKHVLELGSHIEL